MTISSPLIYQTALAALRAQMSFVPILADGTKSPAVRWKDYQKQMPSLGEAKHWFYGKGKHLGIAFITGAVSGGLEMLDFDSREIYQQFVQRMEQEGLTELLERIEQGYKELSPKGVHLYYRCPSCLEGNKKVARRPISEPPYELSLIETRGEAGYSIGAPSCGKVHPSGEPYLLVQGSLATIQTIVPEDRALLHAAARTFDEMPLSAPGERRRPKQFVRQSNEERRPGTIFNERATWPELLEAQGWTWVKSIGDEDFWRRPGKDVGISATTNYGGSDSLYVFTTSTSLPTRRWMDKFGAYTFLEHFGDFSAATKALASQGYVEEGHASVR